MYTSWTYGTYTQNSLEQTCFFTFQNVKLTSWRQSQEKFSFMLRGSNKVKNKLPTVPTFLGHISLNFELKF